VFLLIAVSCLWAFSFGLIRVGFGGVNPLVLAFFRLLLAFLVFAPFIRGRIAKTEDVRLKLSLIGLGAVQYGLMYVLLFAAYPHIGERSYLIALFTVTTPIFVLIVASILERKVPASAWGAVALAVFGALILRWNSDLGDHFWSAFFLLQGSNLAFAVGQVFYRRLRPRLKGELHDAHAYFWIYLGAALATSFPLLGQPVIEPLAAFSLTQWLTLAYLGIVASGLAFFAWNRGATQVSAPQLAVLNNLKIPLAVLVSLLVFGEWRNAEWANLAAGSSVIGLALWLAQRTNVPEPTNDK
jgi:drug/metabolite transporter (DMT)-like permease